MTLMVRSVAFWIFWLGLGIAVGLGFTSLLRGVVTDADPRTAKLPCFEFGAPFHHRHRPNCVGPLETPTGPVRFSVNEDALRDEARASVLRHENRFLVVGGGSVEGWWSEALQALPTQLGVSVPGAYFVNAGLRDSGAKFESGALPQLLRVYRPRALIWVLDDAAWASDRLACAVETGEGKGFSLADQDLSGWRQRLAEFAGDSPVGRRLRAAFHEARVAELERLTPPCDPCSGTKAMASVARAAGIPLAVFYLEAPSWGKLAPARASFAACLQREGVALHDVPLPAGQEENFFWANDTHLTPVGSMVAAQAMAVTLRPLLSQKPVR